MLKKYILECDKCGKEIDGMNEEVWSYNGEDICNDCNNTETKQQNGGNVMSENMSTVKVSAIKAETQKAWLATLEDGKEIWFPKSQCKMEDNEIKIPEWLAKEKGI